MSGCAWVYCFAVGVDYRSREVAGSAWEAACYHQNLSSLSHGSQLCMSLFSLPEFFDISNHKCVRAFTFIDLDSCVMVMDYW